MMRRASRRLAGVLLIILPTVMVGSFVWGARSDRLGTRAVVLGGGVLLGLSLVTASQAATLGQFQLLFGGLVGVGAGSFYAPMTALTTHWFTQHRSLAVALVSSGLGLGSMTVGPLARWLITTYDWSLAMVVIGSSRLAPRPAGRLAGTSPASVAAPSRASGAGTPTVTS